MNPTLKSDLANLDVLATYPTPDETGCVAYQEPVLTGTDHIVPAPTAEEAVIDSMANIVAASQESTIATQALTKGKNRKPTKAEKKQFKKMLQQNPKMARSINTNTIMSALQRHVIKTPEQLMIEKAVANTHAFLVEVLGKRQAQAFFKAGPDTLAEKFFTDAFCAANPTVVADGKGRKRTLTEIHEYFIQRELLKLAQVADATNPELGLGQGLEEAFGSAGKSVDPELPVDVADMASDGVLEKAFEEGVFKPAEPETQASGDEPEAFLESDLGKTIAG